MGCCPSSLAQGFPACNNLFWTIPTLFNPRLLDFQIDEEHTVDGSEEEEGESGDEIIAAPPQFTQQQQQQYNNQQYSPRAADYQQEAQPGDEEYY